jgi:predicted membrane-bound spermidine synthase
MNRLLIYVIVFICGGSILALEILGTRIIGPFYGVSLFLWSALISITLIALSVGYMIGGRLADRKESFNLLGVIIMIAGVITILIPVFRNSIIEMTESLGLRTAVLVSSFILFFPPLSLLGMVSPYAIKMRTRSLDEVGTRAGDLYALSTIGSVLAALLTGFVLIPNFGVVKLTLSIGTLLILTSIGAFILGRDFKMKMIILIVIFLISFLPLIFLSGEHSADEEGIIKVEQSLYGEVRIMDIENIRYLLIDGGIHSAVDKENYINVLPYVYVLDISKNILNKAGDMLLIGLGGGSVVKSFYEDNWEIDAVEIDPVITKIAQEYFNLPLAFDNIYHQDGRTFLKNSSKKYDLIILDAFGSSAVPFHLTTVESFKLAKNSLADEGLLAINIEAFGWSDIIVESIGATLKELFRYVEILPIAEPPNTLGNIIILASDMELELKQPIERDLTDPDYRFSADYEKNHSWENRFKPSAEGMILTDDLNPVEIWSERINLQARKELHEFLGRKSFLW